MKRGWIFIISVLVEIGLFLGIYYLNEWLSPALLFLGATKETPIMGIFLRIAGTRALWKIMIGAMFTLLVGFLLVYCKWAPNNLFFTFIPEGRAKHVVRGDAYRKTLIQWRGHSLATQKTKNVDTGDVIEVKIKTQKKLKRFTGWLKKFFGGFRFYGWWPFDDIYIYDFEWVGMKQNGELDPHPKETLDHVLLKDDVYGALVEQAEDMDLLPLNIRLALTIKVLNPYKALFNVQNWYEMVINRITPYVRDFVTTNTYQEFIQGETRIDKGVMERLISEGILKEFKNRYGVELRKIEVKDIDPAEDSDNPIRKATIQRYLAAREGERRAGETIGALVNMMAEATGKSTKEVKEEIAGDKKLKEQFSVISQDLIQRRMAIDGKSFAHIKVDGAEGIEKMLLNLLTASRKIPQQGKPSTKEKEKTSSEED